MRMCMGGWGKVYVRGEGGVMGCRGRGAYVPPNDTSKICPFKSKVLKSSEIGYLGPMSGRKLHRKVPIQGTDWAKIQCVRYPS